MTQTTLRLCLIGAGEMATTHALNLAADPRVTLAHVVDPSRERAEALAASTGARASDPDTAFADPDIAAYLIASPPRSHADHLDRAAATAAYVFCEKPIDHDLTRARACVARFKGREHQVQIGFNRRFDAQFIALKAAITSGRIGRPEQVLVISRDAEAPAVAGFEQSSGLLKETAVHDFDLIRWLLDDEVAEVSVMADALINPAYLSVGQIDTATTTLRMRQGTHVTVLNSLRAAFGYDQRIEVMGSLGQAAVGNVTRSQLVVSTAAGIIGEKPHPSYFQRYNEAYRSEIRQFIDAAAQRQAVTPDARDGLRASEIAEAAIRSMSERRPVRL